MWGRSAQLWGHRRRDALTVFTMAWSPLFLTLVAVYTGDWMGGTGEGPVEDTRALLPALMC